MTIGTYTDLQSAVAGWMDRDTDPFFMARLPDGIALAEMYFNRKLRCREMIKSTSFNTVAGIWQLPTDLLQVINIYWTGNPVKTLDSWDDQPFQAMYGKMPPGQPQVYLVRGNNLYVAPVDDNTSLTFDYYQRIAPLSGANPTNWLLTTHPDAYLFGTLVEMEAFTEDANAAMLWKQRRDEVCDEIMRLGQFWRAPASAVRIMGATP